MSVHPPFTDLRSVQTVIESDKMDIALGAQHCHWEEKGAFTGEVSPALLAKLNVSYVIAGHSERRELFGETDEIVNRKVQAILGHGMTPILCCGETLEERDEQRTDDQGHRAGPPGLAGVSPTQVGGMVIAYEPIWAIGTGRTAIGRGRPGGVPLVRSVVEDLAGADAAAGVRIQYGGSVKADNAAELMGAARHRRRPGGRRQPRRRQLRQDHPLPAALSPRPPQTIRDSPVPNRLV